MPACAANRVAVSSCQRSTSFVYSNPVFPGVKSTSSPKNFAARSKGILGALKAVTKADAEYKIELRKYYSANGVTLKPKK